MNLLRVLLCSVLRVHPSDVPPKSKISVQIEKSGNGRRNGAFLHISFKIVVFAGLLGVRQRPPQGAEFVCVPCGANNSKSVGLITRAGSTPATGTTPWRLVNPWYDWVCGLFFMLWALMYCPFHIIRFAVCRLISGGTLEGHKASCGGVHTHDRIGGCHFRGEIQVRVNVWGGRNVAVTQPLLNFFQAYTVCVQQACTAMPLRYNYDKPEKPRISRVFGYLARFFILFQTEKSSREAVIS